MPLLTAAELAQLRSDLNDLLPDTCTILRPSFTNNYGDSDVTWGTATASAPCRFDPDTSRKDIETIGGRDNGIARYIVTLQYNATVFDGDRLGFGGKTYQITELHGEHSARAVKRLKASLVQGE